MSRWRRRSMIGAGVLGALALSAWLLAVPVASRLLEQMVAAAGYPGVSVSVTGFHELHVLARQLDGAEPVLDLTVSPARLVLARLTGGRVHLGRAVVGCPGGSGSGSGNPLSWLLQPLPVAVLPDFEIAEVLIRCGSLQGTVAVNFAGGGLDLTGRLQGSMPGLSGLPVADVALKWQPAVSGHLPVISGSLDVRGGVLAGPPLTLVLHVNPDRKAGGRLATSGSVGSREKKLDLSGTLDLEAGRLALELTGGLAVGSLQAEGLRGKLSIGSFVPLDLDMPTLTVESLYLGGLPLTQGRTTLKVKENILRTGRSRAQLLGGQAQIPPFSLPLLSPAFKTTVDLSGLDLAQLVTLGNVNGLAGEGRLSGTVPVVYAGGKLAVGPAELLAQAPGTITYQPDDPPAFVAPGGQGALIAEVFRDFRYQGLTLRMEGTLGDNLTLGVRLAGSNPAFYNGHKVVLNLNLSGALESLLTQGLQSFRFSPEALGQLVREEKKP